MTRTDSLDHEFVSHIPDVLDDGILYVSIPFTTALHKCCCGCGNEVVTPFHPDDWKMTFDGETVSLYPSIGNWNFVCQSHYWISRNRVKWDKDWTEDALRADRDRYWLRKVKQFAAVSNRRRRGVLRVLAHILRLLGNRLK